METKKIKEISLNGNYANIFFEGDDKQYGANLQYSPEFSNAKVGDTVSVTVKEVNGKWYVNMAKAKAGVNGASKFVPNPKKDALTLAVQVCAAGKVDKDNILSLAKDFHKFLSE